MYKSTSYVLCTLITSIIIYLLGVGNGRAFHLRHTFSLTLSFAFGRDGGAKFNLLKTNRLLSKSKLLAHNDLLPFSLCVLFLLVQRRNCFLTAIAINRANQQCLLSSNMLIISLEICLVSRLALNITQINLPHKSTE